MKKTLLFIAIFCIYFSPVFANSPTPTTSPTQSVEKIKNLVKESLTTTEANIQKETIIKYLTGFSGMVKTVGTKNITIETEKDLVQTLITDDTIITKGSTEIKTSSIAIGDNLLVYGQKNEDDIFTAKQIYVQNPPTLEDIVISKSQIATINNLDVKKKTFTLTINNEDISFTLSKKNTVNLEDFKNGDTIFGVTKKYQGKFSLSKAIKL